MRVPRRIVRLAVAMATAVATAVPAAVSATEEITVTWTIEEFTLDSGRSYFARVPGCMPAESQTCVDFMARPRQVMIYLHGARSPEDVDTATTVLEAFGTWRGKPDTVFVYAVSAGGTRYWDAGICCTTAAVDDVGYLAELAGHLGEQTAADPTRVGLFGASNGGMLALRAVCERSDAFAAGISWAGTYAGDCSATKVSVAQMHGAEDTVVPVHGGTTWVNGRDVTFPPAAALAERMQPGTQFPLTIMPGWGHSLNQYVLRSQIRWLLVKMR